MNWFTELSQTDIFKAFLEVSGYGEEGVRLRFVTENKVGGSWADYPSSGEENLNTSNTVNIPRKDGKVVIEVQLAGNIDMALLKKKFDEHAIELAEITHTAAKLYKSDKKASSLDEVFKYNRLFVGI